MLRPLFACLFALLTLSASLATAQTVRFNTNVGSFDMVLNPMGLADLEPHVENMLAYIESGRYHASTINRAPQGFVLQMGSFLTDSLTGINSTEQYNPLEQFPDLIVDQDGDGQVDFDTSGLTNLRGTVSLALAGDPNTGASSFFVNLTDNSFLDAQGFVPFATISDMTVIDQIMALSQQSLDPTLTFSDVPFLDNGQVVVINDTEVIRATALPFEGPIGSAAMTPGFDEVLDDFLADNPDIADMIGAASAGDGGSASGGLALATAPSGGAALPEPTTATLAALAAAAAALRRRRS